MVNTVSHGSTSIFIWGGALSAYGGMPSPTEEEEAEEFYRLPSNDKTGHVVTPESSCRTVYSIYHAALANALRRELFHELVQLCPRLTPQAV